MRPAPLLIALLVLATGLIDLSLWQSMAAADLATPWWLREALPKLFIAIAISQTGLVAVWGSFGRWWLPWRLLAIVLTVAAWILATNRVFLPFVRDPIGLKASAWALGWQARLLNQPVAVFLVLVIARRMGVSISHEADRAVNAGVANGRFQFSLGQLLAWATALPIGLGVVLDARLHQLPFAFRPGLLANGGPHVVLVLAALWLVLGRRWPWLRMIFVAMIGGLLAVDPNRSMVSFLLETLWLVASLAVVRVAGYRLAWHRPLEFLPVATHPPACQSY